MPELQGRLSSVDFQFRNFVNIVTKLKEFGWFSKLTILRIKILVPVPQEYDDFHTIIIYPSPRTNSSTISSFLSVRYSSIETFNYYLGFNTWLDSRKLQLHVLEK